MARPAPMKFIELLVLTSDVRPVLDFLGKKGVMELLDPSGVSFTTSSKLDGASLATTGDGAPSAKDVQLQKICDELDHTQTTYKISGWIAAKDVASLAKELEELTKGAIAITAYDPEEVPEVKEGKYKVPVKLNHGKFIKSFDRMVLSYGVPEYNSVDPTHWVACFFTLLFGLMFGDAGQGLVFLILGILLSKNAIKFLSSWGKFGPVFIALGCSSTLMGILTGEFFANGHLLMPLSRFLTGLFGEPHDHILHLMPSAGNINVIFGFFLFTLAIGFIINSTGLILNFMDALRHKDLGRFLFGKIGLSGALFFWYVIWMAIRIVLLKIPPFWLDWVIIGVSLFGVFMGHPLSRLITGKRPVFEHGLFTAVIEGVVEILEVISSYLSNTISFLRVGAFGLAHAVLGFIISTMSEMVGGIGGIAIMIIGNAIVIVLEGMIVAIQVIRLQYFEFFSKFFHKTGREFKPFCYEGNV